LAVLGNKYTKLRYDGAGVKRGKADSVLVQAHFDDERTETIIDLSRTMKTVIPLRHPAFVAVSWRKRNEDNFLQQWLRMCWVPQAFYFPLETKPFDELQEYTGVTLNRQVGMVNSLGKYPEKQDLQTARDFLGDEWGDVQTALNSPIGRKFYDSDICGVRSP